jgi:predicted O-linked N-acetylglucosamine transferase (SPINDLY family)
MTRAEIRDLAQAEGLENVRIVFLPAKGGEPAIMISWGVGLNRLAIEVPADADADTIRAAIVARR